MTTVARPLPEHGTTPRYQGNRTGSRPPCRCRRCVDAHTKACAARLVAHLAGTPPRVPTGPVAEHVRAMNARGMSCTQIAIAAGVSVATVANAAEQRHAMMHRTVADKILAVRPRIVRDTDRLPVVGTRRRLQALYAIGHSYRDLTEATGISDGTIRNLVAGRTTVVTAATYKAVRVAYRTLAIQPGTSTRTTKTARINGWHTPDHWDDPSRIDDPTYEPDEEEKPLTRDELAALRRKDIEHLASYGIPEEQIAERVGLNKVYVHDLITEIRTGVKRDRKKQVEAA